MSRRSQFLLATHPFKMRNTSVTFRTNSIPAQKLSSVFWSYFFIVINMTLCFQDYQNLYLPGTINWRRPTRSVAQANSGVAPCMFPCSGNTPPVDGASEPFIRFANCQPAKKEGHYIRYTRVVSRLLVLRRANVVRGGHFIDINAAWKVQFKFWKPWKKMTCGLEEAGTNQ